MDPHRCNCLSLLLLRPTIPGISSPSATHTFQDNSMCRGEERRGNCTFRSATHTFARITLYRTTGRGHFIAEPFATHTFTSHTVYHSTEKGHATLHTSATHTFRDNSMCRRGNLAHKRHTPPYYTLKLQLNVSSTMA